MKATVSKKQLRALDERIEQKRTGLSRSQRAERERMYRWLDRLRESGRMNMLGARPFLERQFSISRQESGEVFQAWCERVKSTKA